MDGQSRILWDFMETAFRTGTLDEILRLSGTLTDGKYDNFYQSFADAEDYFMSLDDPSVIEDGLGHVFGILQDLSDEEVLEGIGFILGIVNPWMETMRKKGGEDKSPPEAERRNWAEMLPKAGKAIKAVTLIGVRSLADSLGKTPPTEHGKTVGVLLNRSVAFINGIHSRNPGVFSGFMSGLFETVDRRELRRTADILAEAFLDQRPKLVQWVGATVARRARRFLFRRKLEGKSA